MRSRGEPGKSYFHSFDPTFLHIQLNIVTTPSSPSQGSYSTFAKLCELAKGYNLTCDLEFMPWTGVKALPDARDIVLAAGQENGGVLIDGQIGRAHV